MAAGTLACGLLAVGLAACGSGGPGRSGGSAASAGSVFAARRTASFQQVQREVDGLYRSHPGIATVAVQDVAYTARSGGTALRECGRAAGAVSAGASSQAAESSQTIACAPLIFFLYSYGKQESVPAAVDAAGDLYWYAVTHITGPANARASLDELLHGWKLPVPGLSPAQARNAAEAAVVTAAQTSMLAQKSVHVIITGRKGGSAAVAERIVADIGIATGTESVRSGPATATIRVTRQHAYISGTPDGLTTFVGLPAAAASKVRSRWVDIRAGTAEYQDLATEDTISSLPASILPPGSGSAVQLHAATRKGKKVYVLDWKTSASGSSAQISEELVLAATGTTLPISETTAAGGNTQTVSLGRWGTSFTVPVPPSVIPYSRVTS